MMMDQASDQTLSEAAYLVERGVRAVAEVGSCNRDPDSMGEAWERLAQRAPSTIVPFVVDVGDYALCGYATHGWAVDLYEWATTVAAPQGHQVRGLLLGYSPEAIARFMERMGGEP